MTEVLDNKQLTEKLGALTEFINDKLDIDAMNSSSSTGVGLNSNGIRYVLETYIDPDTPTNGYRIWSDSYCEQWGIGPSGTGEHTVDLVKTYVNTNYTIFQQPITTNEYGAYSSAVLGISNSNFTISVGSAFKGGFYWKTSGYIVEG